MSWWLRGDAGHRGAGAELMCWTTVSIYMSLETQQGNSERSPPHSPPPTFPQWLGTIKVNNVNGVFPRTQTSADTRKDQQALTRPLWHPPPPPQNRGPKIRKGRGGAPEEGAQTTPSCLRLRGVLVGGVFARLVPSTLLCTRYPPCLSQMTLPERSPQASDALEGKGPQGPPQRRLDRRLEEVAKAVGGSYCRLQMSLRPALGVRETVAGHRLGALGGGVWHDAMV